MLNLFYLFLGKIIPLAIAVIHGDSGAKSVKHARIVILFDY